MNPLRIHLQLIGMAILWGASWPWGRMVAQAMPTFVASSLRFFFAIIPKKYNLVLSLLFIVYLFGYFTISKNAIPIMCMIQIFLLDNIFKTQSKIIQIGKIIIIVASIILFIDSILSL